MKKSIQLSLFLLSLISFGQQTISLETCYELAYKNYPIAKQNEYMTQKSTLEIDVLNKGKLPKIDLNAQATYQSAVTQVPIKIPNSTIIPPNKDQYRATLDVNQLLYNGGLIDANARIKESQTKTQQQQIEVSLHQLKPRINQLYFSVLLLQEQTKILKSKQEQLISKIKEVKSGVKFGALLPASEKNLEAENLKLQQQLTEISFEKKKMLANLASLTYSPFDENTQLLKPTNNVDFKVNNKRPELQLFDLQTQQLDANKEVIDKSTLPKLNAFGQAGYGNPGLNMLDNSFQPFYIVGLKANWNLFDWNKSKIEKQLLQVSESMIQTEKETFLLNTQMQLQEQETEINKLQAFIKTDNDIIELREHILKTADAQLRNGVINSAVYIIEITNLFEAKTIQKTHEIQLALAQANYLVTKGTL
ncbi:TolC family protein [Flavobacterium sp. NG2]|uniref:TolC family protein n=1 Tax=Flavobacterium sp. NG2 TaxID=3097547 RepID=UPI002A809398|nr:TolC family protein [Flavobacterium sp. NG2]WPR71024.1 TolC family protein [Flavobacterium sp. NG2]